MKTQPKKKSVNGAELVMTLPTSCTSLPIETHTLEKYITLDTTSKVNSTLRMIKIHS